MFFSFFSPLGKKRSKFGSFLDKNSITQQEIAKESHVSKSTISRLCESGDNKPNMRNGGKIIKTLRKNGFNVDFEDFWDL